MEKHKAAVLSKKALRTFLERILLKTSGSKILNLSKLAYFGFSEISLFCTIILYNLVARIVNNAIG